MVPVVVLTAMSLGWPAGTCSVAADAQSVRLALQACVSSRVTVPLVSVPWLAMYAVCVVSSMAIAASFWFSRRRVMLILGLGESRTGAWIAMSVRPSSRSASAGASVARAAAAGAALTSAGRRAGWGGRPV
jgi:hypothetical protein